MFCKDNRSTHLASKPFPELGNEAPCEPIVGELRLPYLRQLKLYREPVFRLRFLATREVRSACHLLNMASGGVAKMCRRENINNQQLPNSP